MSERTRQVQEALAAMTVWAAAIAVTAVFAWIVADVVRHGVSGLSGEFLTSAPLDAGRGGGIGPILVSTGMILVVCLGASLPIGIGTAIFLAEYTRDGNLLGRLVRRSLDVLAGVPSIVFGLFGSAFFCQTLKMGFSILSGGLTLACMVLPVLIRTAEEGIRSVSQELRLNAAALGLSRTATLGTLVLPAAAPGLVVGFVLGVGRALAETAALIFTSGYVDRMPSSLLDSGRALSVHIFDLAFNVPGGNTNAYAAAFVLIALLMAINGAAAWAGERWLHGRLAPT